MTDESSDDDIYICGGYMHTHVYNTYKYEQIHT